MRLIDADALMDKICARLSIKGPEYLLPSERDVYKVIDEAPTIDAVPVRHAKRIVICHEENSYSYVCEACGIPVDICDNFCRGCGAKIDGEQDG